MADMTEWRERARERVGAKVAARMAVLLAEEPATEPAENATENGSLSGARVHVVYESVLDQYNRFDRVLLGVLSSEEKAREMVATIARQRNATLREKVDGYHGAEQFIERGELRVAENGMSAKSDDGAAVMVMTFVVDEL